MPNEANPNTGNIEKSSVLEDFHTSKTGEDKELDRIADDAARKASTTEKHFDRDHDIFTK